MKAAAAAAWCAQAEEEAARLAAEAERLALEEEAKAAHQAQVQGLRELLAEGKPAAVAAAVKALSAPNLAGEPATTPPTTPVCSFRRPRAPPALREIHRCAGLGGGGTRGA